MNKKVSTLILMALILSSLLSGYSTKIHAENSVVKSSDFEGSTGGFINTMGNISLELCNTVSHSGSSCLKATNRKQYWHGPSIDCSDLIPGTSYRVQLFVYHENSVPENVSCTLKTTDSTYSESYTPISYMRTEPNTWTELSGNFTFADDTQVAVLYIETSGDTTDIYIDDFMLTIEPAYGNQQTTETLSPAYDYTPQQQQQTENIYEPSTDTSDSTNSFNIPIVRIIMTITIIPILVITLFEIIKNIIQNRKNNVDFTDATDEMTQTFNKTAFDEQIKELSENPMLCKGIHITICDINYLENINNSYGTNKGDDAIARCGQLLMNTVGSKGTVYRTDGDEFICLSQVSIKKRFEKELQYELSKYEGYPFSIAVGYANHNNGDIPDINIILEKAYTDMRENKKIVKNAPVVL